MDNAAELGSGHSGLLIVNLTLSGVRRTVANKVFSR
jgi:hypothetical protein